MNESVEKFLEYYCDEDYTLGIKYFSANNKTSFSKIATDFFSTLELVETSYRYNSAIGLLKDISKRAKEFDFPFDVRLFEGLCEIEKYKLDIDKNIYNSNVKRLISNTKALNDYILQVSKILSNVDFTDKTYKLLAQKISDYTRFSQTLLMIVTSYEHRWEGDKNALYKQVRHDILDEINTFIKEDKNILGFDLKTHVSVLDKFYSLKEPKQLYIDGGNIGFNYYATVDMGLKNQQDVGNVLNNLKIFKSSFQEETLEDIWSGLKSKKKFAQKYRWEITDGKKEFVLKDFLEDGSDLVFDVDVYYYSLGIFNLSINIDILKSTKQKKISLTDYRYILSLGTNFAMSENFTFKDKKFAFLKEFVVYIFKHINEQICKNSSIPTNTNALYFEKHGEDDEDKIELSSFTLCNLYEFSQKSQHEVKKIEHIKELVNSFSFKGLEISNREIRTCIDNWVFYTPEKYTNLAPIRYGEDEIIKVNRQQAVVILPNQANWVRAQAVDSILMALAIRNLLSLNIKKYKQLLYEGDVQKEVLKSIKKVTNIEDISSYKNKIQLLLDLVNEGTITQFYDHTLFMEKLFKELNVENIYKEAVRTLERFEVLSKEIFEEKRAKKYQWIFTIVSSFLGASALKDLFEIVNTKGISHLSTKDFLVSPLLQLIIIFGISIVLILNQKGHK